MGSLRSGQQCRLGCSLLQSTKHPETNKKTRKSHREDAEEEAVPPAPPDRFMARIELMSSWVLVRELARMPLALALAPAPAPGEGPPLLNCSIAT